MRYPLDTHVLLWLLGEPSSVPPDVRTTLQNPKAELLVSAASAMEIVTTTRLGKLPDVGSHRINGISTPVRRRAFPTGEPGPMVGEPIGVA